MDISNYHRGYHGDANETFFVGNVPEPAKKLVKTTHECLMMAINEGNWFSVFYSLSFFLVNAQSVKSVYLLRYALPCVVWWCLLAPTLL